jgi:hypothetical protein
MVCEQPRGRRADTASAASYHRNPVGQQWGGNSCVIDAHIFGPFTTHAWRVHAIPRWYLSPIVESASPMANFTANP